MTASRAFSRIFTPVLLAGAVCLSPLQPSYAEAQNNRAAASMPPGTPMSFADLIERVSPAVVSIEATGSVDPRAVPDLDDIPPQFREFFERFGGPGGQQPQRPRRSQGSGFFISAEGLLVTNEHVISGADSISVTLPDGAEYSAEVVGRDAATDIALLRVTGAERTFAYVNLDRTPTVRVGDWVVAVGNPFGLGGTATAGIVSAIGRPLGNTQLYTNFLQIDAPINRGNSGGPAFDLNGNVVGVNSAIFSPTGGNVGIGFAIPSDLAASVVDQLIERGEVRRGYLGIAPQSLTADLAESLGLPRDRRGVLVAEVIAGTPAAEAGLRNGDVIIRINNEAVNEQRELFQRIGNVPPGGQVDLRVIRDGRERNIRVRLAERPEAEQPDASSTPAPAQDEVFGMRLTPADEAARERVGATGTRGLLVGAVRNDSEAARRDIRSGDVILEAGGRDVSSVADLRAAIEDARSRNRNAVLVLVARQQGGVRYVALSLEAN